MQLTILYIHRYFVLYIDSGGIFWPDVSLIKYINTIISVDSLYRNKMQCTSVDIDPRDPIPSKWGDSQRFDVTEP